MDIEDKVQLLLRDVLANLLPISELEASLTSVEAKKGINNRYRRRSIRSVSKKNSETKTSGKITPQHTETSPSQTIESVSSVSNSCSSIQRKQKNVTFWVEHLMSVLSKCCAQHRWDDAAKVLYAITHESMYTSEVIWKAGFQILCNHPSSSSDLVKQFAMNVLQLKSVFKPAIMLDWIMYYLTRGDTSGAQEALQLNKSYRQERQMNSYSDNQKYVALILQGYEGTLLFAEWLANLESEKSSNGEIAPNQQAMLGQNLRLEGLANKAMALFQDLFLHEGNWDIFVTKYIDLMEFYNHHDQALNVLLNYCKLNPHNPNGYIFAHDFLKEHFPQQKSTLRFVLKGLALICPSDRRVLDLPGLMSYQDNNVDLEAVFKLLDYEAWRNDPKPWKKLGSIVTNLHRIPVQSEFEFLGKLWQDRASWWPKYHFRMDQVTAPDESSAELVVNKALVVATLSGVGDPFVEKVRKVVSESPYSELLLGLNHVQALLKRLDDNSSGASDNESIYPDATNSSVRNPSQLFRLRNRNLATNRITLSSQKSGICKSRNRKVNSLKKPIDLKPSPSFCDGELDRVNLSNENATYSSITKSSQQPEHHQDHLCDEHNTDSSSSVCSDVSLTADSYDASSNTSNTPSIHSEARLKSINGPTETIPKSQVFSIGIGFAADSSHKVTSLVANQPKLPKLFSSITRLGPQQQKQPTNYVTNDTNSYKVKEADPTAAKLTSSICKASLTHQQQANQEVRKAGDLSASENNAPNASNQETCRAELLLQNGKIVDEDMAINYKVNTRASQGNLSSPKLYSSTSLSPSVHNTKRSKKLKPFAGSLQLQAQTVCQINSDDACGGLQNEDNELRDRVTIPAASLECGPFSEAKGLTKSCETVHQKLFSSSVVNKNTPMCSGTTSKKNMVPKITKASQQQEKLPTSCMDEPVCMSAVKLSCQMHSDVSPAIVQQELKLPTSSSKTMLNMMVSPNVNKQPKTNKLSLKKRKRLTDKLTESKACNQPGVLNSDECKSQLSPSRKLFLDEASCDVTSRTADTLSCSVPNQTESLSLPLRFCDEIVKPHHHTSETEVIASLPSPIPKSSSESRSADCTSNASDETNSSMQSVELELNLTDSNPGETTTAQCVGDPTQDINNCGNIVKANAFDKFVTNGPAIETDEQTLTQALTAVAEFTFTDSETSDMVYDIAKVHAMLENDINDDSSSFKWQNSVHNEKLTWKTAGSVVPAELLSVPTCEMLVKEQQQLLSADRNDTVENIFVIADQKRPQMHNPIYNLRRSKLGEESVKCGDGSIKQKNGCGISHKGKMHGSDKIYEEHNVEKNCNKQDGQISEDSECMPTANNISQNSRGFPKTFDDKINVSDLVHDNGTFDDADFSNNQPYQNFACNERSTYLKKLQGQLATQPKPKTDLTDVKKMNNKAVKKKLLHKHATNECDEERPPAIGFSLFDEDNPSENCAQSTGDSVKHLMLGQASEIKSTVLDSNNIQFSEPLTCSVFQQKSETCSSKRKRKQTANQKIEKTRRGKVSILDNKCHTSSNLDQNVADGGIEKVDLDKTNSSPSANCWTNAEFVANEVSERLIQILDSDATDSSSEAEQPKKTKRGMQPYKDVLKQGHLRILNDHSLNDSIGSSEENWLSNQENLNPLISDRGNESEISETCSELVFAKRTPMQKHVTKSKKRSLGKANEEEEVNNSTIPNLHYHFLRSKRGQTLTESDNCSATANQRYSSDNMYEANSNQDASEVLKRMMEITDTSIIDSHNATDTKEKIIQLHGNNKDKLVNFDLEEDVETMDDHRLNDDSNLKEKWVLDENILSSGPLEGEETCSVKNKNHVLGNVNVEKQQNNGIIINSESKPRYRLKNNAVGSAVSNKSSFDEMSLDSTLQDSNLHLHYNLNNCVLPDEMYWSEAEITQVRERVAILQQEVHTKTPRVSMEKNVPDSAETNSAEKIDVSYATDCWSNASLVTSDMSEQIMLIGNNTADSSNVIKTPKKTKKSKVVKLCKDYEDNLISNQVGKDLDIIGDFSFNGVINRTENLLDGNTSDRACGPGSEKLMSELTNDDDVPKSPIICKKHMLAKRKAKKKRVTVNEVRQLTSIITLNSDSKPKQKHKVSDGNNATIDEKDEAVHDTSPGNTKEKIIINLPEESCWSDAEMVTQVIMTSGPNIDGCLPFEVTNKLVGSDGINRAYPQNLECSVEGETTEKGGCNINSHKRANINPLANTAESSEENVPRNPNKITKCDGNGQKLHEINLKNKQRKVDNVAVNSETKKIKNSKSKLMRFYDIMRRKRNNCALKVKRKKSQGGNRIEGNCVKVINCSSVRKAIEQLVPGLNHCASDHPLQRTNINSFSNSDSLHSKMTTFQNNKLPAVVAVHKKKRKKSKSTINELLYIDRYRPLESPDEPPLLQKKSNNKVVSSMNDSEVVIALVNKQHSATATVNEDVLQLESCTSEDVTSMTKRKNIKLWSKANSVTPCQSTANIPLAGSMTRAPKQKEISSTLDSSFTSNSSSFNISAFNSLKIVDRLCVACARDLNFDKGPDEVSNFVENCWIDAELVVQAMSDETNEAKAYTLRLDSENQQVLSRVELLNNSLETDICDEGVHSLTNKKRLKANDGYDSMTSVDFDYLPPAVISIASVMGSEKYQKRKKVKAKSIGDFSIISSVPYATDDVQNDVSECTAAKSVTGRGSKKKSKKDAYMNKLTHNQEPHCEFTRKMQHQTKTQYSEAYDTEGIQKSFCAANQNEFDGIPLFNICEDTIESHSTKKTSSIKQKKFVKSNADEIESSFIQIGEATTQQSTDFCSNVNLEMYAAHECDSSVNIYLAKTTDSELAKKCNKSKVVSRFPEGTSERSNVDWSVKSAKKIKHKSVVIDSQRSPISCFYIDKVGSTPLNSDPDAVTSSSAENEHKKRKLKQRVAASNHSPSNANTDSGKKRILPKRTKDEFFRQPVVDDSPSMSPASCFYIDKLPSIPLDSAPVAATSSSTENEDKKQKLNPRIVVDNHSPSNPNTNAGKKRVPPKRTKRVFCGKSAVVNSPSSPARFYIDKLPNTPLDSDPVAATSSSTVNEDEKQKLTPRIAVDNHSPSNPNTNAGKKRIPPKRTKRVFCGKSVVVNSPSSPARFYIDKLPSTPLDSDPVAATSSSTVNEDEKQKLTPRIAVDNHSPSNPNTNAGKKRISPKRTKRKFCGKSVVVNSPRSPSSCLYIDKVPGIPLDSAPATPSSTGNEGKKQKLNPRIEADSNSPSDANINSAKRRNLPRRVKRKFCEKSVVFDNPRRPVSWYTDNVPNTPFDSARVVATRSSTGNEHKKQKLKLRTEVGNHSPSNGSIHSGKKRNPPRE